MEKEKDDDVDSKYSYQTTQSAPLLTGVKRSPLEGRPGDGSASSSSSVMGDKGDNEDELSELSFIPVGSEDSESVSGQGSGLVDDNPRSNINVLHDIILAPFEEQGEEKDIIPEPGPGLASEAEQLAAWGVVDKSGNKESETDDLTVKIIKNRIKALDPKAKFGKKLKAGLVAQLDVLMKNHKKKNPGFSKANFFLDPKNK